MNPSYRHEHKGFIDTILDKAKAHSRLAGIIQTAWTAAIANPQYAEVVQDPVDAAGGILPFRSKLIKEQEELMEDIENSLYLKLDEVGESE